MSIEAMKKALNYIENTESELGIKLSCGDALREALAAQPPADSAPLPDQDWREWLALSASEKACYHWPDDTDLHRQCRAAYIAGATDYSAAPQEVRADSAILNEIGEALECRGYVHMTNGRDIGRLLDELERLRGEPQRSSADNVDADEWEKRIREKVFNSGILTNGEWVYLVGLFQKEK